MNIDFSTPYKRKPNDLKPASKAVSRRSRNKAFKQLTSAKREHKPNTLQRPSVFRRKMPAHWDKKVDALLQQAIQTIDNYMRQATQQRHSERPNRCGARKRDAISKKDWRGCTAAEQKQYKRVSLRSWRSINCLLSQTQQGARYFDHYSKSDSLSKRQQ